MLGQVLTRVSVRGQPSGLHTAGHLLRLTTILSTHCFSSTFGFQETFMNVMAATKSADVNPKANHTATVFFLHGLGDTGHGWCDGFSGIKEDYIRYSCPHAPVQSVSLNHGMKMPSWFDIQSLSFSGPEDEAGIKQASLNLQSLVQDEEKKGIPSDRIIIGGFSQGGAVALHAALTMNKKIGGLILLSTWLPLHAKILKEVKGDKSFPVFQAHGTSDPVVNFALGKMSYEKVKSVLPNITFKDYGGMGHSSSPTEMVDVKEFIKKALPNAS
ncbi:acyl-protein thioesterase 1-like [Apostichopus japonicus]|uniref:acyl-protein thioesterase 1-like n=1 Tax=Stichopus japonicus TaxID=307972 RepID=UPI003AB4F197